MKISSINTSFIDYPGKTSMIVFMSGCTINCKGCQNVELQNPNYGVDVTIDDIIKQYNSMELCSSIVFSGGDPLYQSDELIDFCKVLNKFTEICVYTGEDFYNVPPELFQYINLLITGPYVEALGGVSSDTTNQQCWDISNNSAVLNKVLFKQRNKGK